MNWFFFHIRPKSSQSAKCIITHFYDVSCLSWHYLGFSCKLVLNISLNCLRVQICAKIFVVIFPKIMCTHSFISLSFLSIFICVPACCLLIGFGDMPPCLQQIYTILVGLGHLTHWHCLFLLLLEVEQPWCLLKWTWWLNFDLLALVEVDQYALLHIDRPFVEMCGCLHCDVWIPQPSLSLEWLYSRPWELRLKALPPVPTTDPSLGTCLKLISAVRLQNIHVNKMEKLMLQSLLCEDEKMVYGSTLTSSSNNLEN